MRKKKRIKNRRREVVHMSMNPDSQIICHKQYLREKLEAYCQEIDSKKEFFWGKGVLKQFKILLDIYRLKQKMAKILKECGKIREITDKNNG